MALPLIVGFDGSKPSLAAAEWAAGEAMLTGSPVRLVLAHWPHREGTPVPDAYVRLQSEAVDLLGRTVEDLRARHLGLQVDYELLAGEAPTQLLHAAEHGSTLVLGSRGTGGFAGLLLGSTALETAGRAEYPVVLVRDHADPRLPRHDVVLGLELGEGRAPVIEFALAEAERRNSALRVVHAWLPSIWWAIGTLPPGDAERTAIQEDVTEKLQALLQPLAEKYPRVRLHIDVRTGSAAHILVDEANHAGLLVLGRRRQRAVSALGPAAHAAVHYGHSAVAIVPHA
ncbi:universal stress protein [Streptacidiphilus pinicola]|uniref:Universal stress protein n=1 Tax=Streptacidiphilus pinicola TaxID=2219663 RepID=A0A2X0J929_9ACTN|nr:universal stress protein [Streptacidiphilus pinicola]RAG86796.1 universal stress protein [Streptacidiphilus pinicola]